MRIIALFNLKEGVDPAEYETWSREVDIPGVNALTSVHGFTTHKAVGLFGSDGTPPYQYIEVIDIVAMEPFVADVSDPTFQQVASAFGGFADDPKFIITEDL